jgi:hypothetical protein
MLPYGTPKRHFSVHLPSVYRPNPRSERYSYPFSDSFSPHFVNKGKRKGRAVTDPAPERPA